MIASQMVLNYIYLVSKICMSCHQKKLRRKWNKIKMEKIKEKYQKQMSAKIAWGLQIIYMKEAA